MTNILGWKRMTVAEHGSINIVLMSHSPHMLNVDVLSIQHSYLFGTIKKVGIYMIISSDPSFF